MVPLDVKDELRKELDERHAYVAEREFLGYAFLGATILVGCVLAVLLRSF